eukprot:7477290-Prorocentrum_lima.AAC.1
MSTKEGKTSLFHETVVPGTFNEDVEVVHCDQASVEPLHLETRHPAQVFGAEALVRVNIDAAFAELGAYFSKWSLRRATCHVPWQGMSHV